MFRSAHLVLFFLSNLEVRAAVFLLNSIVAHWDSGNVGKKN